MSSVFTGFLIDNVKVTVDDATGAGTSTINSTALDMTGFDGVLFLVKLGTAAANNSIKAQSDVTIAMSTAADLAGTAVSSSAVATLKTLIVDLTRPVKTFVRATVVRGTSTTIDAIVAIQYKARQLPVAQAAAAVIAETWNAPADGTA